MYRRGESWCCGNESHHVDDAISTSPALLPNDGSIRRVLTWMLFCALVGSGCGRGGYEERMKQRLAVLATGSSFYVLLHPDVTAIYDTGVALRLPKVFDSEARGWTEGDVDDSGLTVGAARLHPPAMKLPGFQFCYEKLLANAEGRRRPIYAYFAVIDAEERKRTDLMAQLQEAAAAAFPGQEAAWQEVPIARPSGETETWSKISVDGPQQFDCSAEREEIVEEAGRLDLYLLSTVEQHVLIGWRGPADIAERIGLFEAAQTAIGTLEIGGPAPTPPDSAEQESSDTA